LHDYSSHIVKRYEFIRINIARCTYAPRHLARLSVTIVQYNV